MAASMAASEWSHLDHLPDEMFIIIKATSSNTSSRLGRLALPGRKAIDTPHYLGITSRGVVPHITQDNFARNTSIAGVYVGLEDCKSPLSSIHASLLIVCLQTVSHRARSFSHSTSVHVQAARWLFSFAALHRFARSNAAGAWSEEDAASSCTNRESEYE